MSQFLTEKIPVAALMGIQVTSATTDEIHIRAPLDINHNHMGTAFGGSLSTLMILSCYSWLFTCLEGSDANFHIVIKDAQTKYLLPVAEDLVAVASRPEEGSIQDFLNAYTRKGVGRIVLSSRILNKRGEAAATLQATFVAKK